MRPLGCSQLSASRGHPVLQRRLSVERRTAKRAPDFLDLSLVDFAFPAGRRGDLAGQLAHFRVRGVALGARVGEDVLAPFQRKRIGDAGEDFGDGLRRVRHGSIGHGSLHVSA